MQSYAFLLTPANYLPKYHQKFPLIMKKDKKSLELTTFDAQSTRGARFFFGNTTLARNEGQAKRPK